MKLDSNTPQGPISDKWTDYKDHLKLVAPNNRPKIDIIRVRNRACRSFCCWHCLEKWDTMLKLFAFKILLVVHTQLLHKEV